MKNKIFKDLYKLEPNSIYFLRIDPTSIHIDLPQIYNVFNELYKKHKIEIVVTLGRKGSMEFLPKKDK